MSTCPQTQIADYLLARIKARASYTGIQAANCYKGRRNVAGATLPYLSLFVASSKKNFDSINRWAEDVQVVIEIRTSDSTGDAAELAAAAVLDCLEASATGADLQMGGLCADQLSWAVDHDYGQADGVTTTITADFVSAYYNAGGRKI